MELHAARVDPLHHLADVIDGERHAHGLVAHAAAGRVGHLRLLEMEARGREVVERAGVVVVEVGHHHVRDVRDVDADGLQRLVRLHVDLPAAKLGLGVREAGIDHHRVRRVPDDPDEIVDGLQARVIVRVHEVEIPGPIGMGAVLDGQDFVGVGHGPSSRAMRKRDPEGGTGEEGREGATRHDDCGAGLLSRSRRSFSDFMPSRGRRDAVHAARRTTSAGADEGRRLLVASNDRFQCSRQ